MAQLLPQIFNACWMHHTLSPKAISNKTCIAQCIKTKKTDHKHSKDATTRESEGISVTKTELHVSDISTAAFRHTGTLKRRQAPHCIQDHLRDSGPHPGRKSSSANMTEPWARLNRKNSLGWLWMSG